MKEQAVKQKLEKKIQMLCIVSSSDEAVFFLITALLSSI